jgi:hypothetical protein
VAVVVSSELDTVHCGMLNTHNVLGTGSVVGNRFCCWVKNKHFVSEKVFIIKAGREMEIK